MDDLELLKAAAQAIYDKKGFNITAIDVRGVSSLTDYFLIAEANVDRHAKALGQAAARALREEGLRPSHTEGLETGDWIVMDCWQIVVHIFGPDLRERYQLERLWEEGKIVDLNLSIESQSELSNI